MSQPGEAIRIDRLDIQRAQSAVLVKKDGVEYAIVADDNYAFLDPYWKAMYEAPTFMQLSPFGPPTPIGGSAAAKKVAVGGKLGIVKDPFGKLGTPEYLGATLPLDGYGIQNLALSEDGKVLIGQLKGGYSSNILSPESLIQKPSANLAWDVDELIKAVLAHLESDRLSKHINLPEGTEQRIAWPAGEFYTPAGTAFDPAPLEISVAGNMGDVIEVDLKWLVADALARQRLNLGPQSFQSIDEMAPEEQQALVAERLNILTYKLDGGKFNLDAADSFAYGDDYFPVEESKQSAYKLITVKGVNNNTPYSRTTAGGLVEGDFSKTGILNPAPNLKAADLQGLRMGGRVSLPSAEIHFTYRIQNAQGPRETHTESATLKAEDYAASGLEKFFGDRPLDNPGYSEFTLSGGVGKGQKNDVLDVYRVEQRLKYLGYPAMGIGTTNTLQPFLVDGLFDKNEKQALLLFEKVIRYRNGEVAPNASATASYSSNKATSKYAIATVRLSATYHRDDKEVVSYTYGAPVITLKASKTPLASASAQQAEEARVRALAVDPNGLIMKATQAVARTAALKLASSAASRFDPETRAADGAHSPSDAAGRFSLNWPSAYNAPYWMDIGGQMQYQDDLLNPGYSLGGWRNTQTSPTGAESERYGTSWIRDLMKATEQANPQLLGGRVLTFKGAVDANLKATPGIHATHSLGMAFDLGISPYISVHRPTTPATNNGQGNQYNRESASIPETANRSWSLARAIEQAGQAGLPQTGNYYRGTTNLGYNYQRSAAGDFLALYAVTRNSNGSLPGTSAGQADAGSRGALTLVNGGARQEAVRSALFGNGSLSGSLISKVHVGGTGRQNPLPNLNLVLKNLGFNAVSPVINHQHHYHLYLRPPSLLPIGGQALTAVSLSRETTSVLDGAAIQTFMENIGMLPFLSIDLPPQAPPIQMAQATLAKPAVVRPEKTFTYCMYVEGEVGPVSSANNSFGVIGRDSAKFFGFKRWNDTIEEMVNFKSSLLEAPKYGTVDIVYPPSHHWHYHPTVPGYRGLDSASFLVEAKGHQVKVIMEFRNVGSMPDDPIRLRELPPCRDKGPAKQPVKQPAVSQPTVSQPLSISWLDLPNQALAKSTYLGSDATITFDPTAAGYGWFLDPTPATNEEFLPTANPNEWQARPGSEAAGHMDLLSAFWHEYGHVLGLDHNADAGNFMAATLQPGMLRLLTAEEFTQLGDAISVPDDAFFNLQADGTQHLASGGGSV